ncbi:uncharacterized protein EI97DRAFT_346437, partial [Westerdykella ornata]
IRVDLAFATTARETIAVIEYKKRGQIDPMDFKNGEVWEDQANDNKVKAMINKATRNGGTLLEDNAMTHVKQVAAYCQDTKCAYAALFNWDYLILFHFDKMDRQEK